MKEQRNGNEVIIAAQVFHNLFPHAKNNAIVFEFADTTTLTLTSSQIEALKKDSTTIRDLFEHAESSIIPLSQITSTQFLAVLNILKEDLFSPN
ncbi:MAG: hypothetical protein ACK4HV_03230 [Parachlamydiaceae bacterium]